MLSISRLTVAIERPPSIVRTSLWNLSSVNHALSMSSLTTSRVEISPWLHQWSSSSETPIILESSWVNSTSTGLWASFISLPLKVLLVMLAATSGLQTQLKPLTSPSDRKADSHTAFLTSGLTDWEMPLSPRQNGLLLVSPDSSDTIALWSGTSGLRFRFPSSLPLLDPRSFRPVQRVYSIICSRTIVNKITFNTL